MLYIVGSRQFSYIFTYPLLFFVHFILRVKDVTVICRTTAVAEAMQAPIWGGTVLIVAYFAARLPNENYFC
jgi:hypothetical protein